MVVDLVNVFFQKNRAVMKAYKRRRQGEIMHGDRHDTYKTNKKKKT